ncbi:MAG: hypothetical protein QXK06_00960 [Candidatus Diapherotrites archaeon]
MDKEEKKTGKSFWTPERMLFATFLVLGILVGAIIMHFVVEPVLGSSLREDLEKKTIEAKELQEKYAQCMSEKTIASKG